MMAMRDDDTEVVRLVAIGLEQLDQGQSPDLQELCGSDVDLQKAVAEALGLAPEVSRLQQEALSTDRWLGMVLNDRYRLVERIGIGAMGLVYRARDEQLDRDIAVKLLRTDLLSGSTAADRFEREAEVLASIEHRSVVTVYDRGRSEHGEMFLVMELLRGVGFDRILAAAETEARGRGGVAKLVSMDWLADAWPTLTSEPRPELPGATWVASVATWCAEIADGLQAAHEAGVQHRDVKPSNVLLRTDGRPALLDFGLAARDAKATLATHDGTIGTPAYMAPEQVERGFTATAASDVYGLGATLYHLLTLQLPYAGTLSQVLASLQRRDPVPASRIHRSLPRDLQAILDCAMARQPKDRYATVAAMASDLRAFLNFQPVSVRPVSALLRTWRRARRSPLVRATAATALLGTVAVAAYASWSQNLTELDKMASAAHLELPPDLSISMYPERRVLADPETKAAVTALLDKIVANSMRPLPARMQRAALRLDHGDPTGAAEDMQAIAQACQSTYLCALAERYQALPATARLASDVPLDGLPAPDTPDAHYVAAYHRLRLRKNPKTELLRELKAVAAELQQALPNIAPQAGELLMITQLSFANSVTRSTPEQRQLFQQCLELAVRTEGKLGAASATTCYTAATALVQLNRDKEALAPFAKLVELLPDHFGSRLNYASALRRVDRFDEAMRQLEEAVRIQPKDAKPHESLVNLHCRQGQFELARNVANAAPSDNDTSDVSADEPSLTDKLIVAIEMHSAISNYLHVGDSAAARDQARSVLKRLQLFPPPRRESALTFNRILITALAAGDLEASVEQLFDWLHHEPNDWGLVNLVLMLCPDDLTPEQSAAMRRYLHALTRRMHPETGDAFLSPASVSNTSQSSKNK